jgi:hypothetical protein
VNESGTLPQPISFVRHNARRGMFWLRRAHMMFRAAPLPWLLLLVVYYVLVALAELGPWPSVGKLAASILKPVFAVGFLAAAWSQERGRRPVLRDLFRGFRSNLWALLPLGLVFFAGMVLAVWATALVDGGALIAWLSGEEPSEELQRSGRLQLAFLFGAACALPTILALWFAPALVVFHDAGVLSALWTSLRAALANWRPAGVFGLAVLFYGGVLPAIGFTAARLVGETGGTIIALGIVFPYMLIFLATFQITDYVAYRDVFHPDEAPQSAEPADQAG